MTVSKKKTAMILAFKKAVIFCFCFSVFLLPGQGYYTVLESKVIPRTVRAADLDLPQPADYPVNTTGRSAPWVSARAVLILDVPSAVVLWEKNADEQVLPASTVKIMTAVVALEHYRPEQILKIGAVSDQGQDMNLVSGEEITFESLLFGTLVSSANDAAQALAQNYPGGEKAFVNKMNEKAKQLNLTNTYYANSSGLNDDYEGNLLTGLSLTSARDLARLTVYALKKPLFAEAVSTPYVRVADTTNQIHHELYNINQLLGRVEGLKGVKTGWTEDAGECLVSYVERAGRSVVLVVLGSQDRFGETVKLINWVFENFAWQKVTLGNLGQ